MRDIKVAAVQFEHRNGEKRTNLAKIKKFVLEARQRGVELIAFPECCITGYWFLRNLNRAELVHLAEDAFAGPSCHELGQLATENRMTIGAGLLEIDRDGRLFNTYVVAMPDGRLEKHRKIHCFISEHVSSGNQYTVFDTPHECRIGLLTCYDNNIFENTRMVALQGAEILLAPHQTGGCLSPSPQCMGRVDPQLWHDRVENPEAIEMEFRGPKGREWLMTWLPSRAHDNGMFLIFSNGVGVDDNEVRTGNAMILDCYGKILSETGKADDVMVVAELKATLREKCTGVRWLKSRRPDLYADLARPTGHEQDTRTTRFEGLRQL
jgi:N-carbamoylputrescine amidase